MGSNYGIIYMKLVKQIDEICMQNDSTIKYSPFWFNQYVREKLILKSSKFENILYKIIYLLSTI